MVVYRVFAIVGLAGPTSYSIKFALGNIALLAETPGGPAAIILPGPDI